jgi:Family of unknown function (DUF5995)
LGANRGGGSRPARVVVGAVLLVLALAIACAPPAPAENVEGLPNWPEVLPPRPDVSDKRVELEFDVCPRGRLRCPRRVVAQMTDRWGPLDAECDHRAVFALTYLRTTEEYVRTVASDPHFFSRTRWVNHEDGVFAELYFQAYDRYVDGKPVPEAWRIAFEANGSPNVTGLGDMLLGMSAHINRDLPYALAHVGLRKRDGRSRKPDHDRVNVFLERVVDPLQRELGERYDPIFGISDAEPLPIDEAAALSVVRAWRENAWRNAERLVVARDDPARLDAVRRSIELEAAATARALRAANTVPGYTSVRDRRCRTGEH